VVFNSERNDDMRSKKTMTGLNVQFHRAEYTDADLIESITNILDNNIILAMSTVQDGNAYINSAHYAYNEHLELVIFTHPQSDHSKNVAAHDSVAAAIWNRPEAWGLDLQGLQLFGTCLPLVGEALEEAIQTYTARFPAFSNVVRSASDFDARSIPMRMYTLRIERLKLIDEPRFGKRKWITAPVYVEQPELVRER
jgi:uncharacterized protein YhbP (UPF0306 family)